MWEIRASVCEEESFLVERGNEFDRLSEYWPRQMSETIMIRLSPSIYQPLGRSTL